jgi:integrase
VDRDERALLRSVRLPDPGLHVQACLTPEQSREIITQADEPFKTMFWLIAETGIRGGEVCGLQVEDVDLGERLICVRQSAWRGHLQTPKTPNAVRTFALSTNLASHIQGYLSTAWKENPANLLFCTKRLTPFANADVVEYQFHPILDALGIPRPGRMGLHALRHGSATVLDRMNVPIAVRTERLGHGNFNTTMRYTHAVSADHRKIADELGQIFDPSCPKSPASLIESAA